MHVGNGAFTRHFLRVPARSASARGLSFISSAFQVYADGDIQADFKSHLSSRFRGVKVAFYRCLFCDFQRPLPAASGNLELNLD